MDNSNKKQLTIWRVVSIVLIVALIAVSISWIVTSANSGNNATRSVVDKASQSDNSNPLSLWNDDAKLVFIIFHQSDFYLLHLLRHKRLQHRSLSGTL